MLDAILENKLLAAAIVVVVVPLVLIGYILLVEAILRRVPRRLVAGPAAVAVAGPGADLPRRVPRLPDHRHDLPQLPEPPRQRLRRARQLRVVLQPVGHPHRAAQQRAVGRPAAAVRGRARACSWPLLVDRVRYESVAKSIVFLPLAISFVAAAVIWKFLYDIDPNIGTLQRHRDRGRRRPGRLAAGATAGTTCS